MVTAALPRTESTDFSTAIRENGLTARVARAVRGTAKLWMALDLFTVIAAATLTALMRFREGPLKGAKAFWDGTLIHGRPMWVLLALLVTFTMILIVTSRRLNLYAPKRLTSILQEQLLSVRACLTSGLLLTGTLYLIHAADIPRSIVLSTVGLVTISLSVRRFVYRIRMYSRLNCGLGTRNALIVGTGPAAQALRNHMKNIRRLGYTFKGFIEPTNAGQRSTASSADVVGNLSTLFEQVRKRFVDEVFITIPCERDTIQDVCEQARIHSVELRVVPDLYDGHAWNSGIEYLGEFPTILLHHRQEPEGMLLIKRALDILLSGLGLLAVLPTLLAIAIAIKLDSPGPVLYRAERIGKKGRAFSCFKFRTMVPDADKRRADLMYMNQRDGVLFKIDRDPRITRLGRLLRKYSLDELPQLFNVLRGDMSLVGPRPPLASEVRQYKLSHLRRLDVTPGITGLWQVQARKDPSFDSYISLDVAYIDNWSIWLDFKIMLRTIPVLIGGTGT